MNIQKFRDSPDGITFRCTKCKSRISLRKNTFFEKSKLSLGKIMQLMSHWLSDIEVTMAAAFSEVSKVSAIQWYTYFRDITSWKLVHIEDKLGGPGKVVEIDESLMFKKKHNVGHHVDQRWVFGMYDTDRKNGYLEYVQQRDEATLVPIIQEWILPGTIIHSDGWRAYANLGNLGYIHQVVNHNQNFLDPVTGACTNHVEAYWGRIKRRIKRVKGSEGDMQWQHLDESVYRHWFSMKSENIFENFELFITHVSECYPL